MLPFTLLHRLCLMFYYVYHLYLLSFSNSVEATEVHMQSLLCEVVEFVLYTHLDIIFSIMTVSSIHPFKS